MPTSLGDTATLGIFSTTTCGPVDRVWILKELEGTFWLFQDILIHLNQSD